MDKKAFFVKRINFLTLSAWLIASIFIATTALIWFGQDFRGYYAAARVVLAGGNPYDYHTLAPMLLKITGRTGNNPYYYAPWFAWFIIPLAWLPFGIARSLWMLLNLILWDFSLWQLSNLLNWPKLGWRRWLLFLLATVVFAWITWRYEQTGILLFALLIQTLIAIRNDRKILSGIWLALLFIKPNITLIPVIAISLWLIRRRNWKPVFIMCISMLLLLIVTTIVTPSWYRPFLEPGFGQGLFNELNGPGQIVAYRINTTLSDWLIMLHVNDFYRYTISILVFFIGLVILSINSWKSESLIQVVVVSLLVNFGITPYALQYDFPPLALVLFWTIALSQYVRIKWVKVFGTIIIVFITSVLFWERPISDGYWIVIGLIGLTLLSWHYVDKINIPSYLL